MPRRSGLFFEGLEGAREEQIVVPGEIPRAFYPVIKVGGDRVRKANTLPSPPAIGQDRISYKQVS